MPQLLKNNVSGVLASGINAVQTSITLVDASNFPSPTGGDFFLATLIGLNGNGQESSWEIVRVTARASNTLTAVRAQEGTTAASWTAGSTMQLRVTAGTFSEYATLVSPTFSGTPAAPTAAADTNTTQVATTAFVVGQAASTNPAMNGTVAVGTSLRYARADHVHASDTSRAPLASPTFTGTPAAPTAAVDTSTTQIATTAYVVGQGYLKSATASSTYQPLDADLTAIAALSGTNGFLRTNGSGTWSVDTATYLTGNQSITLSGDASGSGATAITVSISAATVTGKALTGYASGANSALAATDTILGAFGKVQGQLDAKVGLASPAFTGTPSAPTAAVNTNTTQLATTAFVLGQGNSTAGTIAMNGTQAAGSSNLYARADHVHPTDTSRAALASPTFTGTPAAPTAAADTNTTQIATTAYVVGQGYLKSAAASSTYLPLAGGTMTGAITFAGGQTFPGTGDVTLSGTQTLTNKTLSGGVYSGTVDQTGSVRGGITAVAALDIVCSSGNYFTKTINANSTFTVSSVPASRAYAFTLELTHTSGTVTWFSGVQWPGGTAPTLTTGKVHLFTFVTDDGGTSWRGASQVNYNS